MMDSDEGILLEVTVPENAGPLSTVTVQSPDGRFFEVVLPDRVEPGDVITVLIPTISEAKCQQSEADLQQPDVSDTSTTQSANKNSGMNYHYPKIAAIATGVIVGTLVVGPILTGVCVIGGVLASKSLSHRSASNNSDFVNEMDPEPTPAEPTMIGKISSRAKDFDEKNHISETVNRVGHQTYTTIVEIDKTIGVSATTNKIIASAKEIDEKNKISATVINSVSDFDQKYEISATASRAVSSGISKVRTFDADHGVTEKVSEASHQAISAAKDFDSRYEVSATLTKTFSSGVASLSSFLGGSAERATSPSATTPNHHPVVNTAVYGRDSDH